MKRMKLGIRRMSKPKERSEVSVVSSSAVFSSNASLSRRLGFRRSFSSSSRTAATLIEEEELDQGSALHAVLVSPTDTGTSDESWSWNEDKDSETAMEHEGPIDGENDDDREVLDVYRKGSSSQSAASTASTGSSTASSSLESSDVVRESAMITSRGTTSTLAFVPAPTLPGAVEQWFHAATNLAQSDDVRHLVRCSAHVLWAASAASVHVALLPVTLPIHITRQTTQFVVGSCVDVLQSTGTLLVHMIIPQQQQPQQPRRLVDSLTADQTEEQHQKEIARSLNSSTDEQTSCLSDDESSNGNLITSVLGVPWMLLCVAGKVKDDVGSLVFPPPAPAPSTPGFALQKGKLHIDEDYCEQDNFLDRLRLDYHSNFDTPTVDSYPSSSETKATSTSAAGAGVDEKYYPKKPPPAKSKPHLPVTSTAELPDASSYSKFLLPVLDLGVQHDGGAVHYVDLQSFQVGDTSSVVTQALDRMVEVGLSLLANHPTVRLSSQSHNPPPKLGIDWRPEGSTPKLLRKMVPLSTLDRLKVLEQEVLIWSGNLASSNKYPFFLARGVVNKRPIDFTKLLWDNQRTAEYNNFCLGRTNMLVLKDHVLSAGCEDSVSGTKVVQSETRVPFTSLSVLVSCCMHVRPLVGADEGGFVIVSRSLYTGSAGTHMSPAGVDLTTKNEILWGINILRRVPNHPHLTDLTSLSQVGSTLVPRFLATRIGLMGIEDFFKNVRKAPAAKQPPPHRSASC